LLRGEVMVQIEKSLVHNVRVESMKRLDPPSAYWKRYPLPDPIREQIARHRHQIEEILSGRDTRLLIIVGPCSIHDTELGLDYARRLAGLAKEVEDRLMIAMRVYFEKPRTTVGWKGLINDPQLNGTYDVQEGMAKARQFLIDICSQGLPTATEFLDPFTPQYLSDMISWGAIGARTTESQPHRLMASGLSMPIGFKNGTGGGVEIAVDGVVAAMSEHVFLGIDDDGVASVVKTMGNPAAHLILRGGKTGPNYSVESVATAQGLLKKRGLSSNLLVDCSHANSNKDHKLQASVFNALMDQRVNNSGIVGLMLESNIREGNQSLGDPSALEYGVSITDACIGWEETEEIIRSAHARMGS
jgi:3-deoxy-7-phosphoheptulonate synthase